MDTAALRADFPVLDRFTYLNAGTAGPWPHAATVALRESVEAGERDGRLLEWFIGGRDLGERLRAAYAALLGAPPEEVALTSCTSDGIARVLGGLELSPGDEIITSENEHPGLLGPLAAAIAQRGVTVRNGTYSGRIRLRTPGLYRFTAKVGDTGRSPQVFVRAVRRTADSGGLAPI